MKLFLKYLNSNKLLVIASVFVLACIILNIGFSLERSYDFWWHLSVGKWIPITHSFLINDIFSQGFTGKEWFNPSWIFDYSLFKIYNLSGWHGLNIFRTLIFSSTFIVLFLGLRQPTNGKRLSIFVTLSFLALIVPHIRAFMRPELIMPLFCLLFIILLFRLRKNNKLFILILLLQVVWTNLHASFIFGIFIITTFFIAEIIRFICEQYSAQLKEIKISKYLKTIFFILAGSIALLPLNPYGLKIFYWIRKNFIGDYRTAEGNAFIGEWQNLPADNFLSFNLDYALPFKIFAITAIILIILQAIQRIRRTNLLTTLKTFHYEYIGLTLVYLVFAILHHRFAYSAAIVLGLISGLLLREYTFANRDLIVHKVILAGVLSLAIFQTTPFTLSLGEEPFRFPKGAAEYIQKNDIRGPLLNTYGDGGYLIWKLFPEHRIFIDGRTVNLYDHNHYWDYRHITNENVYNRVNEQYTFNVALIENGSSLISFLLDKPEWSAVYFDSVSTVFINTSNENTIPNDTVSYDILVPTRDIESYNNVCDKADELEKIANEISYNIKQTNGDPYSLLLFSELTLTCENFSGTLKQAEQALLWAVRNHSDDARIFHQLGRIYLELDQQEKALSAFERSINLRSNKENVTGKAITLHNLGKFNQSFKVFETVLYQPGELPNEYYQIFGRVNYQLDNNIRAIELFLRYKDLAGEKQLTQQDYIDIAKAYEDAGNAERAKYYFEIAKKDHTE